MERTTLVFLHIWNMTYFEEFRHVISSSIDPLKEWIWDSICFTKSSFQKKFFKKIFLFIRKHSHFKYLWKHFFSKGWWWCLTLKNLCFLLFNELFNKKKILFFFFANILKCSYILYSGNPLCMNFAFWEYAINGHLRIL